jgi:ribose 5-phosphate isomerase B
MEFVSESDVRIAGTGGCLSVTKQAIITPLARETADRLGVELVIADDAKVQQQGAQSVVALGCDHGGFDTKEMLKTFLQAEAALLIQDCGCPDKSPVDYPDVAHAVAQKVARGEASYGVLIDGAGIGSCIAANRHRGVRAAVLRDPTEAEHSRKHNDANVACFRGDIDPLLLKATLLTFLTTEFEGGRHARRVARIEVS